jgi:hypothetical protein
MLFTRRLTDEKLTYTFFDTVYDILLDDDKEVLSHARITFYLDHENS